MLCSLYQKHTHASSLAQGLKVQKKTKKQRNMNHQILHELVDAVLVAYGKPRLLYQPLYLQVKKTKKIY